MGNKEKTSIKSLGLKKLLLKTKLKRPTEFWLLSGIRYDFLWRRIKTPTISRLQPNNSLRSPRHILFCLTQTSVLTTIVRSPFSNEPIVSQLKHPTSSIVSLPEVSSNSLDNSSNISTRINRILLQILNSDNNLQIRIPNRQTSKCLKCLKCSRLQAWPSLNRPARISEVSPSRWLKTSSNRPSKTQSSTFIEYSRIEYQVHQNLQNNPQQQQQMALYVPNKKYTPAGSTVLNEKTI